jgi:hypothetical protein
MITLNKRECRALYLALHRGAQREGEDVLGLILKTSGAQILDGDSEICALVDKIRCGAAEQKYPLYEMKFEDGAHYLPLDEAASWYDCGWLKVEIGNWVLTRDSKSVEDVPNTRRAMTAGDREVIRYAADRHSESK